MNQIVSPARCFDCDETWWPDAPRGFLALYGEDGYQVGYCAPCAEVIEKARTRYGDPEHERELIAWERDNYQQWNDEPSGDHFTELARLEGGPR